MIRKLLKRVLGRQSAPPPPAPARAAPPPRPAMVEPRQHDHGHSHDHHGGHDHGHSHGGDDHAPVGQGIRVEESDTPNPNAHKFTCSVTVIEKGSASFNTGEEADSHPIARHLWRLGGIKGIFAVKDFVTVTKAPDADWATLSPRIPDAIRRGLVERDGA